MKAPGCDHVFYLVGGLRSLRDLGEEALLVRVLALLQEEHAVPVLFGNRAIVNYLPIPFDPLVECAVVVEGRNRRASESHSIFALSLLVFGYLVLAGDRVHDPLHIDKFLHAVIHFLHLLHQVGPANIVHFDIDFVSRTGFPILGELPHLNSQHT